MRHLSRILAATGLTLAILAGGTAAGATEDQPLDWGPIPQFELVSGCQIRFDPPTWITVHLVNDTDGTVTDQTVPYTPDADHWVYVDVQALFGTDHGTIWSDRWSLGTGDTAHVPYDCRPPAPDPTCETDPALCPPPVEPPVTPPPPAEIIPPAVATPPAPVLPGPPELATTGTGEAIALAGIGAALVTLGWVLVRATRRPNPERTARLIARGIREREAHAQRETNMREALARRAMIR